MRFLNALVMSSILLTYGSRYENFFRFALPSPFLFTICGRYFLALNSIAIAIHHSYPFQFLPIINHFLHTHSLLHRSFTFRLPSILLFCWENSNASVSLFMVELTSKSQMCVDFSCLTNFPLSKSWRRVCVCMCMC